jgi:hypothetical protein
MDLKILAMTLPAIMGQVGDVSCKPKTAVRNLMMRSVKTVPPFVDDVSLGK